ncbi:hypothetical protein C343_02995 [Cryptococcus neoformans C23]|uniref:Uncharacterized protein n=1 Tax=Cryptococcus neoformans (strain H99 / ATCC 208821 / CBS 10515 / FGSC 9487) TaxID=235443 RepID=T2BNN8_CRYN9|nr:hypothetical protein CNAG_07981 [Cryptococcus neoformans var. grubii H99]AUB24640.1 hypothetical protein CKF44_07981 [Cryptococcus neoformans var. grubii]OWZ32361.1 hypothetical protein C347_03058 [Cryptococcus neoformans var. grubii AD2-60a]OWZ44208.1 hypothetical protein C343_02995 [Cryptococcus neoformans var. grubii C23]OWZ44490.1 hypothetical protein C353_02898 [Cryptococcus neoformans var. grubii AD1-83a]OWZ57775.1 hypothetical protein C368_00943 [Cryptococcus neoformans var. grubii 1|eukprot:XP_012049669.1 hypothetical protein CNAG_07981 [Cryptococcus neoformans var. grubii H99]
MRRTSKQKEAVKTVRLLQSEMRRSEDQRTGRFITLLLCLERALFYYRRQSSSCSPRTTTTTMMDDASLQILPGTGPDFLEMFPITTMLQYMKREVMGVMHKNGGKNEGKIRCWGHRHVMSSIIIKAAAAAIVLVVTR